MNYEIQIQIMKYKYTKVKLLSDGNGGGEGAIPAVGYTQRATIDCVRYIESSPNEYNVSLIRGISGVQPLNIMCH